MKNLIKNIDLKLLFTILGLIIYEAVIFFLTKPFIQNPYIIGSALDNKIPFVANFVWIYIAWYLMLVFVPYYIYLKNKSSFFKYMATFIITTIIAGIIFIAFPNAVVRATINSTDIASSIVKIIYTLDSPGINCFPSIHCLYSFLFIFAIFDTKQNSSVLPKVIISVLSILVVLSTLFIKQHVIYDALISLVIGLIIWIIVDIFKLYNYTEKIYNKFKIKF